MKLTVEGVKPPLEFVPPRLNRLVVNFVKAIAPFYVKRILGLKIPVPERIEILAREYQHFFNGNNRLILVFRHVHVHDAQVMFYLFDSLLPREARRAGVRLPRAPHAHFLYGRGVPLWAGKGLEWLFSRAGGIPVFHRRLAREGIDEVRAHLSEGAYPIALAPEGQVTYHNGVVHPIEPGFAQLALWAREDLEKKGLPRDIRILPISQYYRYGEDGRKVLEELLGRIQKETGITFDEMNGEEDGRMALRRAGAAVLTRIEEFYRRFYDLRDLSVPEGSAPLQDCSLSRVERLVDAVLKLQEGRLGILHPPKEVTPRIFTVRQAGWNRIFRKDLRPGGTGSPLDESLDDYVAVEAGLFARHLEVVDLLAYLQPEYALESKDTNRHIEFALNLLDGISRMKGGTIGGRYHVRPSTVHIHIGEPISLDRMYAEQGELSLRQQRSLLVKEVTRQFKELSK